MIMKGWIRLAIVLAALWLLGCVVMVLVGFSQSPTGWKTSREKPSVLPAFFKSTEIPKVYVRFPPVGIIGFPSDMSRE